MAVASGDLRRRKEAMDHLVIDISKGDEENISSAIRIAIERGWLNSFMDSLTEAKRKKESEIDRICSRHYGDFLNSVNEMLKLRGNASKLSEVVSDIHRNFASNGTDLAMVLSELNTIQIERENAFKLLEKIKHCKKITSLMMKTSEQIASDDYYNAMRSIEMIQADLKLITIPSLLSHLQTWLPIAINKLLYGVRTDADNYIQKVRDRCALIGSTIIIRQAMITVGISTIMLNVGPSDTTATKSKHNSSTLTTSNSNNNTDRRNSGNENSFKTNRKVNSISLQYIILHNTIFNFLTWAKIEDFHVMIPQHFIIEQLSIEGIDIIDNKLYEIAPLHKVLHLYAVLGDLNSYHEHYRIIRINYLNNILNHAKEIANNESGDHGLTSVLPLLFDKLIGFFTIECANRRCVEINDGVFSYNEIIQLWENSCQLIYKLCKDFIITVTSPDILIRIKDEIILLMNIINDEAYLLPCDILHEILRHIWEIFKGLLTTETIRKCIDISNNDCAYQPYVSSSEEEFLTQVKAFQLDIIEPNDDDDTFLHLPTSPMNASEGGGIIIPSSASSSRRTSATTKLKEIESRREKNMLTEKASANLDALEEELMNKVSFLQRIGASSKGGTTLNISPGVSTTSSHHSHNSMATSTTTTSSTTTGMNSPIAVATGRERSNSRLTIKDRKKSLLGSNNNDDNSHNNMLTTTQTRLRRLSFSSNHSSSPDHNNNNNHNYKDHRSYQAFLKKKEKKSMKTFAFSNAVPQILRELYSLLIRFFLYAVRNDEILGSKADDICQIISNVIRTISTTLSHELVKDGLETPLSKACQIAIDSATLVSACDSLWLFVEGGLKHFHWTENLDNYMNQAIEIGTGSMKQVVIEAQHLIFELLTNKIDDLLQSLAFINYIPTTIPDGPHESISSIVDFLQITFVWLTHLPKSVKEAIHFACCSRLAQGILTYITSSSVAHINILCILAFDYDLKILYQFTDSSGIKHLKQCFHEMHEVVKCILHPALLHYGENKITRMEHFPNIQTFRFLAIIEKMVPVAVMTTAATSKLPFLDKNSLKNLVKKIKTQL